MSANDKVLHDLEQYIPMKLRDDVQMPMFKESALKGLDEKQIQEKIEKLKSHRFDQTLDYGEPEYLLYQNGVGFMPRGDIQAIKAQQKNGKSMLMDYFMGAILRDDGKYGCLECRQKNMKVLYVDTEMQKRNTSLQSKRVHTICGWPVYEERPNFDVLTLRGEDEDECRLMVELEVMLFKPDAVFIDGIKDLCPNFNDLEASAQLIRWEMNISTLYNCAVCSVLHVNPNSEKMRGHLGTEEQNKCSDVFTVIKNKKENGTEVTFKVKQTDARNRDIEDFEFICDSERYGTPMPMSVEVQAPDTESYTMAKAISGKSITISFTQNQSVDMLTFLHNLLTTSSEAPSKNKLRQQIRSGNPLLDIPSEDKADAWIDWAINNGYLETSKGPHNSTIVRWKQGAVIPMKEATPTDSTMPF